jgi:hypothetical protein
MGVGFAIPVFFILVGVTVVLKLVFKAKWLTVICLWILAAAPLLLSEGWRNGLLLTLVSLTAVICLAILLIRFFRWLVSGDDNARVNAAERDRILRMVEQAKISSEEST